MPPTGATMSRADWFAAADRMLGALAPFRSGSGALIALPGRVSWSGARSDDFEGYARSFLLLALRVAGAPGPPPPGRPPPRRPGPPPRPAPAPPPAGPPAG
ncbi:DUF2264 domain-containing protein, partial [Agromyces soli]